MAIKRKFPPRVATVYCSGGCRAKKDEDGALLCAYGCIGCEACVNACRFDAIHLNDSAVLRSTTKSASVAARARWSARAMSSKTASAC